MSSASIGWPNSSASPSVAGKQAGQHLHRRRLAAAVRAEKAEDLAALDGEAHAIDGGEIAESAGQIARDDDGLAVERPRGGICERAMIRPAARRQQAR